MEYSRQENYTVMEGYEIPSQGKIYDKKVPAVIELRCMTGRDELKRLAHSAASMKVLADVIENCMIEKPEVHVYDMALGDYEFLLQRLRVITYGTEYKMSVQCPHCRHTFEAIADLDQLTVKPFDEAEFRSYETFKLPVTGSEVKIKFQTPRMVDTIEAKTKEMRRKFKGAEVDFHLLNLLQAVIDEVDGMPLNPATSDSFINKLPMKDIMKILNNLDKLNACVGVDTDLFLECEDCNEEVAATFWYGPEFFRPTTI